MANERSKDDEDDKSATERELPNPREVLGLMVSVQRLCTQVMWQMGEAMGDVMAMPLERNKSKEKRPDPLNRTMSDLKDAVDSATEILQQRGKTR